MITLLLHLLRLFPFLCGGHRQLALENLALHQQLAVYKRTMTRPRLRTADRFFFSEAGLSRDQVVGRIGRVPVLMENRNGAFFRLVKCTTSGRPGRPPEERAMGKGTRK